MTTLLTAHYALHRQKSAVERALRARTAEESLQAVRWAGAWHRLVQRLLDQKLQQQIVFNMPGWPASSNFSAFGPAARQPAASRVLH